MYETYPKSSPNPNLSVGEQDKTKFTGGKGGQREYNGKQGPKATVYNGDKSKTTRCEGNKSKKPGNTYPKKSAGKFGTEVPAQQKVSGQPAPKAV